MSSSGHHIDAINLGRCARGVSKRHDVDRRLHNWLIPAEEVGRGCDVQRAIAETDWAKHKERGHEGCDGNSHGSGADPGRLAKRALEPDADGRQN